MSNIERPILPQELSVDVCVVGAGGAGLSAAAKALESGASVCLIEKMKAIGGTSHFPGGMFAVETKLQEENGVHYSVDDCWRYHMDRTNWECDARLVREWYKHTNETIEWLTSKGLEFKRLVAFSGTTKSHHLVESMKTGHEAVLALTKELDDAGVPIYTETRATKLIRGEDGAVAGVVATNKEGKECTIHAKAVVLSSGSISHNEALIKRFYPGEDMQNVKIMANVPHNTGDGLLMAEEIGAGTSYISTLYIGPQNHDSCIRMSLINRRPQVMKVNHNGQRFADEAMPLTCDWGWFLSVACDRQPNKEIFGIFDQSIMDEMTTNRENYIFNEEFQGNMVTEHTIDEAQSGTNVFQRTNLTDWLKKIPEDMQNEVKNGCAIIANTLDEVAEYIGCDPDELKETVANYNRYCEQGYDEEMLKDPKYLQPIKQAPYYVLKSFSGIDTCIGGLKVDYKLRILDKMGTPIPGLYGAGVVTSGWLSHNYGYFGSEFSYTVFSGRYAGLHATEFAKKK